MNAKEFISIATDILSKFDHKEGCDEPPEIVSHPVTGQIGMACRSCKRLSVITNVETSEPTPVPRFKV